MCYSAAASFTVAGALGIAGALSVYKTKKQSHLPFATIPLFFATQQTAEGLVWLSLNGVCPQLLTTAMYTFLFFAFIFWPVWIPFSLWMRETKKSAKVLLQYLMWWGAAVAAYSVHLLLQHGATVKAADNLQYDLAMHGPVFTHLFLFSYAIAVLAPFFISSVPYTRLLGSLVAAALVYAYFATPMALTSVWCFFAAIASAMILWITWHEK